ncbi:monovalent cation/H+ antiporter subunit D family protein [Gammaproteobacteria bacterium]|nr:monovalent cation/H+ antiporter subunit D family protein [Gammaproteobacteria bacterium]
MNGQLAILQIVVPLTAAPITALFSNARLAWLWACGASLATFAISILLYLELGGTGELRYHLGGWPPPWGIEVRIDSFTLLMLLLVSGASAAILPAAGKSLAKELKPSKLPLYFSAWLLLLTALIGIVISADAFNVFVFFEISSLATYALLSMGPRPQALLSTFRYLVMGTVGASFFLIGVGLLYSVTGTLNMDDLAMRIPALSDNRIVHAAFVFVVIGVAIKAAIFPLHWWLPNAYLYAPSITTVFLAASATKVSLYVLVRFLYSVFGVEFSFGVMQVQLVLVPLALVAVIFASLIALSRRDVKRLLAWSTVAQIGYMVLGIASSSTAGLAAGIMHMFNHGLIKAAMFLALAGVIYRVGSSRLDDLAGTGRTMPWTMGAFIAGGISLMGVPTTVGFVSKWNLIHSMVVQGWWWAAVLVIVSSVVAVFYIWRVVEVVWFDEPPPNAPPRSDAPMMILVPAWLLVIANFWLGMDTTVNTGLATAAADLLLGGR